MLSGILIVTSISRTYHGSALWKRPALNIRELRGYADFALVPAAPGTFAASSSNL